MKMYPILALVACAVLFPGRPHLRAQGSAPATPSTSSTPSTSTTSSIPPAPAPAPGSVTPGDGQVAVAAEPVPPAWDDLKGLGYEMRTNVFAGVALVEKKFDGEITALNQKRAAMTNDTDNWDFAMKEVNMARSYLRSMATELTKATTKDWNDRKDKITDAVARLNNALSKVRASTTS